MMPDFPPVPPIARHFVCMTTYTETLECLHFIDQRSNCSSIYSLPVSMFGAMDDHAPGARFICRFHGLSLQANRVCN